MKKLFLTLIASAFLLSGCGLKPNVVIKVNNQNITKSQFDKAYEKGYFDKLITTNLTYHDDICKTKPYYIEASMSMFLARIIDFLNHDAPMSAVLTPTEKIHDAILDYNEGKNINLEN